MQSALTVGLTPNKPSPKFFDMEINVSEVVCDIKKQPVQFHDYDKEADPSLCGECGRKFAKTRPWTLGELLVEILGSTLKIKEESAKEGFERHMLARNLLSCDTPTMTISAKEAELCIGLVNKYFLSPVQAVVVSQMIDPAYSV